MTQTTSDSTSATEVDRICRAAQSAAATLDELGRDGRAAVLRSVAEAMRARSDDIVAVADEESSLGTTRLGGELTRTCFQLDFFADVISDGGYLEATIDHAHDSPMGPIPDLRRMLVPLGPVAVFGASNFPLAFSVPGGDTASALAAGCPVVVKAHEAQPRTSALVAEILGGIVNDAVPGAFGVVYGREAGIDLVKHPAVRAVGFTGSLGGGTALLDAIATRDEPIPMYGELSSLNPVIVTKGALGARGDELAEGLFGSFTMGAGQFCTKPGLVFVPGGDAGDAFVDSLAGRVRAATPATMLTDGIATSYSRGTGELLGADGVASVAESEAGDSDSGGRQQLLTVEAAALPARALEECFGPLTVVARYGSTEELAEAVGSLPGSLTATIHAEADEADVVLPLSRRLRDRAGRLLFAGFPTGVGVSWAQHHGGPWPSTNTQHTSVGATAIRRFLRPVTWQSAPAYALPVELRDPDAGGCGVPVRVDGSAAPASTPT